MSTSSLLTPYDIKLELDKKVIGQEALKKMLSIVGFLHSIRPGLEALKLKKKETILIMGPSGSGKTYSVKALADLMGLPLLHCNATEITRTGYVGDTLADMLITYKKEKEFDRMIVFIDEFDKISANVSEHHSLNEWNAATQHSILTALEGGLARTESKASNKSEIVDTSKMLFILGGAFEKLRKKRSKDARQFGLVNTGVKKETLLTQRKELESSGIIKEICGRITAIVETTPVTDEMLRAMVLNKFGVFEEYKAICDEYNVYLELEELDFEELFQMAKELDIGGRIVDAFLFNKIKEHIYEDIRNI